MKKGVFIQLLPIFIVLIMPFASSQITFNQFSSVYNLGDSLSANPVLLEDKSFNGMVKVTLQCGGSSFLFYTSPIEITAGAEKKLDVPALKIANDQGMLGNCYVETVLEDNSKGVMDEKSSENFKISDNITVTIQTNKEEYEPGKKVVVSGRAVKENGQNVNGNASITLDITLITDAKAGFFTQEIILDKNIKSGEHEITVNVADGDKNIGAASKKINVKAIPSKIEMQLNSESFMPEDKLEASLKVYDQANDEIQAAGTITIYDPDYIEISSKNIDSQTKFEYSFSKTAKPGTWEIIVFSLGINAKKFVEVQKVRNISMEIENNSILLKNEGNVPYNDILTFNFDKDNKTEKITKEVSIEVGGVLSIPIRGNGIYNINVESKDSSADFSGIALTGGALGVGEKINLNYAFVAVFVLFIAILAVISFNKRKKDKEIDVKKVRMTQSEIEKKEKE